MTYDTLADVAGLTVDQIVLGSGATVTARVRGVSADLTAPATVLGQPGRVGIRFFVDGGALASEPVVTMDSASLRQLAAAGVLPPSTYAPADLPDVTFVGIVVEIGENRVLRFTGAGPAGSLGLGVPDFDVSGTSLAAEVAVPPAGTAVNRLAYLTGTLALGGGLPVRIDLPNGRADWRLSAQGGTALGGLTDLSPLTGAPPGTLLPVTLAGIAGFAVADLGLSFSTRAAAISATDVSLSTTGSWTLVPSVLAVTRVTVDGSFVHWSAGSQTTVAVSGAISGTIQLFDVDVDVSIPLPPGAGPWHVESYPGVTVPGVGDLVTDLADLAGAGDVSGSLPPGLDTLGSLVVDFVALDVDVSATTAASALQSLAFRLSAATDWTVPYATAITIGDAYVDLRIDQPLGGGADRVVTGALGGTVFLGSSSVPVRVERPTAAANWTLSLAVEDVELGLADLLSLAGVDPTAFAAALPPSLSILDNLALTGLEVGYDITAGAIDHAGFSVDLTDPWPVVPGYLVFEELGADVEWVQFVEGGSAIFMRVTAEIELAGVGFVFTSVNDQTSDGWLLTARMADGDTISLTALIEWLGQRLLSASFRLPASFPSVTATGASVQVRPATAAFSAALLSAITWAVPFAGQTLSIDTLHTAIDVGAAPAEGDRPYTFQATGAFRFAGITGAASFTTSNATDPTVVAVAVTTGTTVSAAPLVGSLAGASAWTDVPAPADFARPDSIAEAGLVVDLTNDRLVAHGSYAGTGADPLYAAVALLVGPPPATDPTGPHRYAVAAQLDNWTFARLSTALAPVDAMLGVRRASASVLLSQLDGQDVAALSPYVPAAGTTLAARRGLGFAAELDFSGGALADVAALLGITAQGPFAVTGFVPAEAGSAEFHAHLGSLELLGLVRFDDIDLSYLPASANAFTLTGTVVVHVDQDYSFAGAVRVVRSGDPVTTVATATIATTQQIEHPLGIPQLTLTGLTFELAHTVGATTTDTQYAVSGAVQFTDALSLRGHVWFHGGTAAVTAIDVPELRVDDLFAAVVGTRRWPTGLLDITFRNGRIWYAPAAVSVTTTDPGTGAVQPLEFAQGFHAAADIDVYMLTGLHVDVAISDTGIVASGGYRTAVDWGFVTLYRSGTEPTAGPVVQIDSAAGTFTLVGGFALFGTPVPSLTLTVGDTAMSGQLAIDQQVGPFDRPALDFVWDDDGFRVTNWPLGKIKLPDFDIENLRVDGACPVSGIVRLPVTSKVDVTPSFTVSLGNDGTPVLNLTLTGTLDLVVASSAYRSDPILTANLGQAKLSVPFPGTGRFTWDSLGSAFVDCITNAAGSIFKNLVEDPANLAKLLAVAGVEWAGQAVIDFLDCRGATAAEASAFVAAAGSAVPVEVAILGVTVLAGGIVGHTDNEGNHHNDGGGDGTAAAPATPGAPTLTYADNVLTVTWAPATGATSYAVLTTCDGRELPETTVTGTSTSFTASGGHAYTARLVAAGPGGTSDAGPAATLSVLGALDLTSLGYADGALVARWAADVPDAAAYQLQVFGPAGDLWAPRTVPAGGTRSATLDLPQPPLPAGPFQVRVRSVADKPGYATGDLVVSPLSVAKLEAPTITGVSYADGTVGITLAGPVAGASAYDVQFVNPGTGSTAGPVETAAAQGTTVAVTDARQTPGARGIEVRAEGVPAVPSDWTRWDGTVSLAGPVTITSVSYADGTLTVTYTASPTATGYQVAVAAGATAQRVSAGTTTTATIPQPPPASGSVAVTVTARAVTTSGTGAWSAERTVTLYGPPADLQATVAGTDLVIAWTAVPLATEYTVELRPGGDRSTQQSELRVPVADLDPQPFVQIVVRATGPDGAGPWSDPAYYRPDMVVTPGLTTVAGDQQSVPRAGLDPPGGIAKFAPLVVRLADDAGRPRPGVPVTFTPSGPRQMAVQVEPSGGQHAITTPTDPDGLATMAAMLGDSVHAYYAEGQIAVVAVAQVPEDQPSVTFTLTVAPTPPRPPLPGATLTIVSGNGVSQPTGGRTAHFPPLVVQVHDAQGRPAAGALVDFAAGQHPTAMAVQVDPSGAEPTTVVADGNGVATLAKLDAGRTGVLAYYATGPFTVVASVVGGGQATFSLVAT